MAEDGQDIGIKHFDGIIITSDNCWFTLKDGGNQVASFLQVIICSVLRTRVTVEDYSVSWGKYWPHQNKKTTKP